MSPDSTSVTTIGFHGSRGQDSCKVSSCGHSSKHHQAHRIVELQQEVFAPFVRRWGLILEERILQTPSGHIVFARRGAQSVVLKLPSRGTDERHSHAALAHFTGNGAVMIVDHADGATLLERVIPGRALTELVVAGSEDQATNILCDVIAALHQPDPPDGGFPHIEDWGRDLERYRHSGDTTIPSAMVDRASNLFTDLAASQSGRRLLHGDLHHNNVLYDERRGWLAIDPKGVLGEPAYEIGAVLRNPTETPALFAIPSIIDRRVRIISERLALDSDRILAWAFAQAVLSAIWAVEDGIDHVRGLATASAILPLL